MKIKTHRRIETIYSSITFRNCLNEQNQMKKIVARGGTRDYHNKIMANLFYQPSTRTRFSFYQQCIALGGSVISTEQATEFHLK
jgi:aspartate carbamoyltransferase catalytic subunit